MQSRLKTLINKKHTTFSLIKIIKTENIVSNFINISFGINFNKKKIQLGKVFKFCDKKRKFTEFIFVLELK